MPGGLLQLHAHALLPGQDVEHHVHVRSRKTAFDFVTHANGEYCATAVGKYGFERDAES